MKYLFWTAAAAVAVVGLWGFGKGSDNLVKNPGFEETDNSGATVAWNEH